MLSTFIAMLCFFWLALLDGMRTLEHHRTFRRFYLPKIALIFCMWLVAVVAYTIISVYERDDPRYPTIYDMPGMRSTLALFYLLYGTYMLWLVYVIVRAFQEVGQFAHVRLRLKFFLMVLLFTVFTTMVGILMGVVGPSTNNAMAFLIYFALFNTYVYMLAFVYSPAASSSDEDRSAKYRIRLGDDDDDFEDQTLQDGAFTINWDDDPALPPLPAEPLPAEQQRQLLLQQQQQRQQQEQQQKQQSQPEPREREMESLGEPAPADTAPPAAVEPFAAFTPSPQPSVPQPEAPAVVEPFAAFTPTPPQTEAAAPAAAVPAEADDADAI
eukprot:TRINITY_DN1610_c0_g1_i2.p1 TRINITY_DN1610_c0_g1~~TRINITY_DN1610_c0_g1_i2.p1  ORF type:complete len:326 (-),score=79.63 TRINITY_DN1610_c0_g1_i2:6-983(-)